MSLMHDPILFKIYDFLKRFIALLKSNLSSSTKNPTLIDCLFVCLWLIVPLKNFSLIWRRHHYRWKAENFDLCQVIIAIKQWGFFNVSHLLWHGASVYNGHLREPVTLTPIAERLAVECTWSLPVFYDLGLSAGIRTPTFPLAVQRSNPLRHRRGVFDIW